MLSASNIITFAKYSIKQLNKFSQIRTMSIQFVGQKVNVDGIDIFYEKVGQGDKVILLLPGSLGASRPDFTPQLEGFDRSRFTMIAWHPPGYGMSRPFERYWHDDYLHQDAKNAAKLMKKLGFIKYSLMGWSGGGTTGLMMAAANPLEVEKLVAWSCNSFLSEHEKMICEIGRNPEFLPDGMKKAFEQLYGIEEFHRLWPQCCDANGKYDDMCRTELPRIRCPTLILHGKFDTIVHPLHADFIAEHVPDCRLHWFPEGKHNIHQKYAEEFNKIVQDFFLDIQPKNESKL